jgi:hypothetical protein
MDERSNIHGIKVIHGIMVARRDIPWLGTSKRPSMMKLASLHIP